jgi:hypothetical protein
VKPPYVKRKPFCDRPIYDHVQMVMLADMKVPKVQISLLTGACRSTVKAVVNKASPELRRKAKERLFLQIYKAAQDGDTCGNIVAWSRQPEATVRRAMKGRSRYLEGVI